MKCTEVMSFRFTKEERRKIETLQKLEADYLKRKVTIKDIVTSQINKAYEEALRGGVVNGRK